MADNAYPKSPFPATERVRRKADVTAEEPAERTQALKTDGKTDVSDSQVSLHEQPPRPLKAKCGQVLVRRLLKDLLESAQEVVG